MQPASKKAYAFFKDSPRQLPALLAPQKKRRHGLMPDHN
jgi:hypothetical protein